MTTAAPEFRAPALTLTTARDPRHVVVDGLPYPLRELGALDVWHYRQIEREWPTMLALWHSVTPITDDERQAMRTLLHNAVRILLDAPADVLEKLTDLQRMQILLVAMPPAPPPAAAPARTE